MLHNKKNNKGFSLIELVVTIAIMCIVTGGTVGIYSLIASSAFKEAVNNITDSLAETRTDQISKSGDYYLKISLDSSNKCVSEIYSDVSPSPKLLKSEKNSKKIKEITAVLDDGSGTEVDLGTGNYIYISYARNGSFKEAYLDSSGSHSDIKGIKLEHSRYSKTINLARNTGKFFVE